MASLIVCPAPLGPRWNQRLPNTPRIGSTDFNVPASPPTIKISSPFFAPQSPPVTGASRKRTLRSVQAAAILRASAGETVLESMEGLPGLSPAHAPELVPSAPH